jgi:hypothetical protein
MLDPSIALLPSGSSTVGTFLLRLTIPLPNLLGLINEAPPWLDWCICSLGPWGSSWVLVDPYVYRGLHNTTIAAAYVQVLETSIIVPRLVKSDDSEYLIMKMMSGITAVRRPERDSIECCKKPSRPCLLGVWFYPQEDWGLEGIWWNPSFHPIPSNTLPSQSTSMVEYFLNLHKNESVCGGYCRIIPPKTGLVNKLLGIFSGSRTRSG